MPIPFYKPSEAPEAVFQGQVFPLAHANPFSQFLYTWITPLLKVGYSRPLQIEDLWSLDDESKCLTHAKRLQDHFMRRMPPSRRIKDEAKNTIEDQVVNAATEKPDVSPSEKKTHNKHLKLGEPDPEHIKLYGAKKAQKIAYDKLAIEDGREYDMSLWYSIYHSVWPQYWSAVAICTTAQALRVTAPLVTKQLLEYLTTAHSYYTSSKNGGSPPLGIPKSAGYGIGLAMALFVKQFLASLLAFKGDQIQSLMGSEMKNAMVDLVARKSMKLSGKSRNEMNNGRLFTLVSSDCMIVGWTLGGLASLIVDPITLIAGIALLIYNLGYSALVGVAVLAVAAPAQGWFVKLFYNYSDQKEQYTDTRVRLLTEILNNVRAVKLYAYERFFGDKVADIRREELKKIFGYNSHRIQTILYYDRILVLDQGRLKEFDTPLNLFDQKGSIFRSLCDTKHIQREDIIKIKEQS
ncbi:uncharacterized protein L201_007859 [Kwoniella dendrophila CBS 6074]|uniref:ABC transmembrane type-1 domain-containing protein n=1 Tax=Kwoniella dendrophila CBS 6074 TaxID=1295534 RepID=A0AAX4K5G9_9TREE